MDENPVINSIQQIQVLLAQPGHHPLIAKRVIELWKAAANWVSIDLRNPKMSTSQFDVAVRAMEAAEITSSSHDLILETARRDPSVSAVTRSCLFLSERRFQGEGCFFGFLFLMSAVDIYTDNDLPLDRRDHPSVRRICMGGALNGHRLVSEWWRIYKNREKDSNGMSKFVVDQLTAVKYIRAIGEVRFMDR